MSAGLVIAPMATPCATRSLESVTVQKRMIRRGKCPVRLLLGLWLGLTVPPLSGTVGALAAGAPDPNAPEQAKSILADHIRDQGFACDRAEEAHRDEALSRPDEPVWTLRCSNAAYRIRLRGNMAAEVEVLDPQP